jgi:hypothetical protein
MPQNAPEHLEAGRRLYAAIISLQLGVGLDYAYRKYTPETVDQSWCDLAFELQRSLVSGFAELLRLSIPKSRPL